MAAGTSKKVGIQRVAEAAGVSTATVSQVYNHKGEVAKATREHVLEVGARLGYRPNPLGQALRSGRSRVIGVVVSYRDSAVWEQTYMPYYRNIIAGAAIEAVEHGYSISAAPSTEDGRMDTLVPLDGVIVVDPVRDDPIVEQSLRDGLAVVTDGGYSAKDASARLSSVRSDLTRGIPEMLAHLSATRATPDLRPALFVGPRLDSYTTDTIAAYRRWMLDTGLEPIVATLASGETPLAAARQLLTLDGGRLNAVHCLNETYCNAVIAAATELGANVPSDLQVSVTGNAFVIGAEPRAAYLNLDPVSTGAVCARTLISLLGGAPPVDLVEGITLVPARVPA
jgi:DNA-binding LacI/PurR family transcriptional regulator